MIGRSKPRKLLLRLLFISTIEILLIVEVVRREFVIFIVEHGPICADIGEQMRRRGGRGGGRLTCRRRCRRANSALLLLKLQRLVEVGFLGGRQPKQLIIDVLVVVFESADHSLANRIDFVVE
jgi:hypothetical protein